MSVRSDIISHMVIIWFSFFSHLLRQTLPFTQQLFARTTQTIVATQKLPCRTCGWIQRRRLPETQGEATCAATRAHGGPRQTVKHGIYQNINITSLEMYWTKQKKHRIIMIWDEIWDEIWDLRSANSYMSYQIILHIEATISTFAYEFLRTQACYMWKAERIWLFGDLVIAVNILALVRSPMHILTITNALNQR